MTKIKTENYARPARKQNAKEAHLLDTLAYWGFHVAAANLDVFRENVNLDVAIASWVGYPQSMETYPKFVTRKVKIDFEIPYD